MGTVGVRSAKAQLIAAMVQAIFLLPFLCTYSLVTAHEEHAFEYDSTDLYENNGRQFALQNVSLVITYSTLAVAVVMMASFLWIAMNFGTSRSGYGYSSHSGYGGYGSDEYVRRKRTSEENDNVWFLGNLIEGLRKHGEQDEEEEDVLKVNYVKIEENIMPKRLFRDACRSSQERQDNNLQSLGQILRLLSKFKKKSLDSLPSLLQKIILAYEDGLAGHSCEVHTC